MNAWRTRTGQRTALETRAFATHDRPPGDVGSRIPVRRACVLGEESK